MVVSIFLFLAIIFSSVNSYSQHRPANLDSYNFSRLLPRINRQNSPGPDSVIRYDFSITLRDGVILDCLKFIPYGVTAPAGGFPTVIMCHGYGDNKNTLAGFCHDQATYGYYTATYSMRGQGVSGGLSNLISTTEMQDLLEFITAVKIDSVNGSNPNNILIMGGSQGGLIPFMAACNGAPVKTIISALAPPNFASSWIENGSIKMTFLWTVTYTPDTARYNSLVTAMSNWVYANNKAKWDSLAYWLPVNRDFMTQVSNNRVPMIIEGSWQDKFFNADGLIQAASLTQVPFRLYTGAVIGHGGDNSPTENTWHMQFFNDWFFYWLFGVQNGILDSAKYQYASTVAPFNGAWTFVHGESTLPYPQITANNRLYFRNNKTLTTTNPGGNKTVSLNNTVKSGLTMQQAVDYEFAGTTFQSKFKKDSIIFESTPFTSSMKILGTPMVGLKYQSTASTFCQFNFQIYEVDPSGNANLVTRGNYTDRNYTKGSKRTASFKGQAHSHIFTTGYKMRIIITNLDWCKNDAWFMGTNPFVLPVLNSGTHTIYCDGGTYIDLPVVSAAGQPIAYFGENNSDNNATTLTLKQNYPNPFNPTTNIEYSIPDAGKVDLKIYDITGKQVAELVNEVQDAGLHTISFNASRLASGIYFYKINAATAKGNFSDVKRMILVK
jgi:predicted acyl esterase